MTMIPDLIPEWLQKMGWLSMLGGLCSIYILASRLYGVFLSPLSKYPGPWLWAMTTIPYDIYLFRGILHRKVAEFHEKYGPVIRIAPDELSFITDDAWNDIYGKIPGKLQLVKNVPVEPGPAKKFNGIFAVKSDEDHARIRRNFSHAFSDKALREQEPIMKKYFDLLMQRLHENCDNPLDIVQWYNSTTFDIIGDLIFGESYQCLEKSRLHVWVSFIFGHIKATMFVGLLKRISPLDIVLLWMLPRKMKEDSIKFREFHAARLDKRLGWENPRLDLMSRAQKTYNTPEGMHIDELRPTCRVFVIGGSETTATLLSGATYLLCTNPSVYQKLISEVRGTFTHEREINIASTSNLKYLSAVLSEALRVFPPVPGLQSRITPPAGHVVSSGFVPGNTLLAVNQWAANYSATNFRDPDEFVPERWLGEEKYKDDKRKVAQPFSVGPRNCIGQNMAWAEMRVILARLLWAFDVGLCEESEGWIGRLVVFTIWKKEPLMVKLRPVVREMKD